MAIGAATGARPRRIPDPQETQLRLEDTPLEDELARLGATHITLAGAASNWCIRATAYGALDRGYDLTLVRDAHTTGSLELEGGRTIATAAIVEELNVAMTWLRYPGRRNGTRAAEAVDFATPGGDAAGDIA